MMVLGDLYEGWPSAAVQGGWAPEAALTTQRWTSADADGQLPRTKPATAHEKAPPKAGLGMDRLRASVHVSTPKRRSINSSQTNKSPGRAHCQTQVDLSDHW